jgi:hypothetical protein
MNSPELDNLVKAGLLKREPAERTEFDGLIASGKARLADARVKGLSPAGQFDLAYNAAHAFALAALRWHGYRPDKRFVVFQALQHTLGLQPEAWRVLDKCHQRRNAADYEGIFDVDASLLSDLLKVTDSVRARIETLGPVAKAK